MTTDLMIGFLTHPGKVSAALIGITLAGCIGMILARRWEQS